MNPILVDTHTHISFNAFKDDGDVVVNRALNAGVWLVAVGTQIDTSHHAVDCAGRYPEGVYAIVGLHPIHLFSHHVDEEESHFAAREEKFDYNAYKTLASHPKVVGIGECGLEYYRLPEGKEEEIKKIQQETFIQQIKLAVELKKPLMVHSRDAYEDVYEILKSYMLQVTCPIGVIIHSFIGNWGEAKKFLDLGCFLSFNGIITYKPRKEKLPGASDPCLLEAVKNMPLDRILLETDAPYLSPIPHRGKRNEPAYVRLVAEKVAELKGVSVEEVASQTTKNARRVFSFC